MASALKIRATVICLRDNKVLLVRKTQKKWNLPGGRVEFDEAPPQAAQRELLEEIGIQAEQLDFVTQLELFETLHHVFHAQLPASQAPQPLNEIAECRWFPLEFLENRRCHKAVHRLFKEAEVA
ncbi:NUDIX domain-containing protein [Pseudomonas resinovorans]|uniref:NUDIX domain-containing protein n=1 Tax=Metapseudomonas resinovorans TaxID=53412 RepID=A0ABT4Y9U8_METRE|nr:NUDIX domain-containing protein [Pseudomonas resinovorans]MDA8485402.1 NUDIX domain-containing protein [Pseudomonas resinovorans]